MLRITHRSAFRRFLLAAVGFGIAAGLTAPGVQAAEENAPRVGIEFTAAGVVNAASFLGGSVAPGEIISIFGVDIGPAELKTLVVADGKVTTELGGVRVLFDGVPAPLVFVLNSQLSAIVPYAVAGRQTTDITIEFGADRFGPVTVPVGQVWPGLFSLDASGRGQGAILNEDGTLNSPENPAERDSIVVLFATGEGVTDPQGEDGRLAIDTLPKPTAAVFAAIGGQIAEILYAGAAPSLVAGVLQVNARMAPSSVGGPVTPVSLIIGGVESQPGLTLALRGLVPLLPGESAPLAPISSFATPDLRGPLENDALLGFQFVDGAGAPATAVNVQDRVTRSANTGKLIFQPRIRDVEDFGSGAVLFRMDISGFGSTSLQVAFLVGGLGNVAPASAERSADGDTLSLIYDPPIAAPQESRFPIIFTDATAFDFSGSITLHARMPGGSVLTQTAAGAASPQ